MLPPYKNREEFIKLRDAQIEADETAWLSGFYRGIAVGSGIALLVAVVLTLLHLL